MGSKFRFHRPEQETADTAFDSHAIPYWNAPQDASDDGCYCEDANLRQLLKSHPPQAATAEAAKGLPVPQQHLFLVGKREGEIERESERERLRETERDRQTDRQTERQRERD